MRDVGVWGMSEEVAENTSHRKLSHHKKLLKSYQGPALGAGISCQEQQACCIQQPCYRKRAKMSGLQEMMASALPPISRSRGTGRSLPQQPSAQRLHTACPCKTSVLLFLPKNRRVSGFAANTFLITNKTYLLLIRLKPRVAQETF